MNHMNGTSEIEVDSEEEVKAVMDMGRDGHTTNPHHPGFPMPRMEIPVFEETVRSLSRVKPRISESNQVKRLSIDRRFFIPQW